MPAAQPEAAKPQGGLFKDLKQKIDSGQSPAPALVSQLPAPRPNGPETVPEPIKPVQSVPVPSTGVRQAVNQDEQKHMPIRTKDAANHRSSNKATGSGAHKGARPSKPKQKLTVCSTLSDQFPENADSGKRKVSLPVGKALIVEQRVGINQGIASDLNVRKEQKRAEEEARVMLERDLEKLEKEELRKDEDPAKAIKSFFSDTIPSLFNVSNNAASSTSTLSIPDKQDAGVDE